MEPLAVDIAEAARLLSLSPRTIRRHIRSGHIQAVYVGRRVLVPIDALRKTLTEAAHEKRCRSDSIIAPRPD